MTGVGFPLAGSWSQMLPSPGAKINLPLTCGGGTGVPPNRELRTGGRSMVADGRTKELGAGVLALAHATANPNIPGRIKQSSDFFMARVWEAEILQV